MPNPYVISLLAYAYLFVFSTTFCALCCFLFILAICQWNKIIKLEQYFSGPTFCSLVQSSSSWRLSSTSKSSLKILSGRQPLKPLRSEVTHPPWPPSVHITNHHYHSHITLFYTTQDISQPTQQHTTYNISHTTIQLHTSTTHMFNHMVMQAHADPMQAVMQSHVLSTPISVVCGCASITWSLIWAIFPSMTSLFDRLCRHMTWWLCILVQFWLY